MQEEEKRLLEENPKNNQKGGKKLNDSVKKSFLKRGNSILQSQNSLNSIVKKFSSLSKICNLCKQAYPQTEMDCFEPCKHYFCHFCTIQYCVYNISLYKVVTCPEEGCLSELEQNSQLFSKLPANTQKRYKAFLLTNPQNHHSFRRCSTENCDGKLDLGLQEIKCAKCQVTFCRLCVFPLHQGLECNENFHKQFELWKLCPVCNLPTEKAGDSNKAVCPRSHNFCFVCRLQWDNSHDNCQQQLTEAERFAKRFKKNPRWLNLALYSLMIPGLPLYAVSLIIIGIPIYAVSAVALTGIYIFRFFKTWKQSTICSALLFYFLGAIYFTSTYFYGFKQLIGSYLNRMKGLLNANQQKEIKRPQLP